MLTEDTIRLYNKAGKGYPLLLRPAGFMCREIDAVGLKCPKPPSLTMSQAIFSLKNIRIFLRFQKKKTDSLLGKFLKLLFPLAFKLSSSSAVSQ